MKPITKNQGVIIKTRDYKENSKIITILTKDGLLDLILKGVTNINSRTKKYTLLPLHLEFLMADGKIPTFTEGFIINNYTKLKDDLNYSLISMAIIEKINAFVDYVNDVGLFYDFVVKIFDLLNKTKYPLVVLEIFEIKLLYLLGIAPLLNNCFKCLNNENLFLSLDNGCTLCKNCSIITKDDLNEEQTKKFKYLYLIKTNKIDEEFLELINNLNINLNTFIDQYYEKYIDFYSKTKKIIKKVT